MVKSTNQPVVIIPNLNGGADLIAAVDSLIKQTCTPHIIVVDNASTDDSISKLQVKHPALEVILHVTNKGYSGGVNPGFKRAIELDADYVAPFNDDAIADPRWLEELVKTLNNNAQVGAACCKVLTADGKRLDSTGDYYTNWGLPYPRGRGELDNGQYDQLTDIFSASGAASLYRVSALKEVGLLDEDFFAYYEDVDLSFRMQLAGWKVRYVPESKVFHKIGMTSSRIKGFTTYQTMKNLPLLLVKNVPKRYLYRIGWRLTVARTMFLLRAISRGQAWPAITGDAKATYYLLKKSRERKLIQKNRKVSDDYIWGMLVHDLPPNADALRKLRAQWWKITGRKV